MPNRRETGPSRPLQEALATMAPTLYYDRWCQLGAGGLLLGWTMPVYDRVSNGILSAMDPARVEHGMVEAPRRSLDWGGPSVSSGGLRVSGQGEDMHDALPDGAAIERLFLERHGFQPCCRAAVLAFNRVFQLVEVHGLFPFAARKLASARPCCQVTRHSSEPAFGLVSGPINPFIIVKVWVG